MNNAELYASIVNVKEIIQFIFLKYQFLDTKKIIIKL